MPPGSIHCSIWSATVVGEPQNCGRPPPRAMRSRAAAMVMVSSPAVTLRRIDCTASVGIDPMGVSSGHAARSMPR